MRSSVVVVVAVLVGLLMALACATPKKAAEMRLMPPVENETSTVVNGNKKAHFAEVKKAAAQQLACPEEKINIVCLRRDSDGECIKIRADGCDKSYEYQFGDI